jgi:hypothetical protein
VQGIKLVPVGEEEQQGIGLDEREWVAGLMFSINPDNLKPGLVVPHRGTPGPAVQIQ